MGAGIQHLSSLHNQDLQQCLEQGPSNLCRSLGRGTGYQRIKSKDNDQSDQEWCREQVESREAECEKVCKPQTLGLEAQCEKVCQKLLPTSPWAGRLSARRCVKHLPTSPWAGRLSARRCVEYLPITALQAVVHLAAACLALCASACPAQQRHCSAHHATCADHLQGDSHASSVPY